MPATAWMAHVKKTFADGKRRMGKAYSLTQAMKDAKKTYHGKAKGSKSRKRMKGGESGATGESTDPPPAAPAPGPAPAPAPAPEEEKTSEETPQQNQEKGGRRRHKRTRRTRRGRRGRR